MSQDAAKRGDMIATPCISIERLGCEKLAPCRRLCDQFHLIHIHHDNNISRFLMVWRLAAIFEIEHKSDSWLIVGRLSVVAVYLSQEMV